MKSGKSKTALMTGLMSAFAILMSLPFVVPHCGIFALFGIIPLLAMERIAWRSGMRKFMFWHYGAFVLWNAITTFWVCNATVAGGIFAILANALQMSVIFGLFRLSRKAFNGVLPYIFLAFMWIAWERAYFSAQISWPWLVLGNSFAGTVSFAQWYEYTGTLGGSLWIWACNLSLFGIITALAEGKWQTFNIKAKSAAIGGYAVLLSAPIIVSVSIYHNYKETDRPLDVLIAQPNIDPYQKFTALDQSRQTAILLGLIDKPLKEHADDDPLLILAPETFTNDVVADDIQNGRTFLRFRDFLKDYSNVNLLFGATSYTYSPAGERPSYNARRLPDGEWLESHNSAIIMDRTGRNGIFHKSKLVVGVEMTPYPALFTKIDDMLGGVMGRCVGQDEISLLDFISYNPYEATADTVQLGCVICYESVYGEYCTGYIKKGAEALAIITNDAWWGDTPGYRQHLRYASLRAIETRRDIARCANTGVSAIIDQRGDILERTEWWEPTTLAGKINLNDVQTFFVREGDIVGRSCQFFFMILFVAMSVRLITNRGDGKFRKQDA